MDAALEELRKEEGEYGGGDGDKMQTNLVDEDEEDNSDSDSDVDEMEYGLVNKDLFGNKDGDEG